MGVAISDWEGRSSRAPGWRQFRFWTLPRDRPGLAPCIILRDSAVSWRPPRKVAGVEYRKAGLARPDSALDSTRKLVNSLYLDWCHSRWIGSVGCYRPASKLCGFGPWRVVPDTRCCFGSGRGSLKNKRYLHYARNRPRFDRINAAYFATLRSSFKGSPFHRLRNIGQTNCAASELLQGSYTTSANLVIETRHGSQIRIKS